MASLLARIAGLAVWSRIGVFVLLGVAAGFGQAPHDLWPITVLSLAAAIGVNALARAPSRSALQLWAFGLGYFGFTLRWIIEPFFVDAARHGWMAPFAIVFMAGGLALFWGAAGYLAQRFAHGRPIAVVLALVWVELARSYVLTGFPWALLGHIWISTSIAQTAAWGGPHLLTLLTGLAALSLLWLFQLRWRQALPALLILAAAELLLRPGATQEPGPDAPIVRMVQPNAPQHQKWDPAYRDLFFNRLVAYTGAGEVPDLVVWPETAIPTFLNYIENDLSVLVDAARGIPLVFGIQRFDNQGSYYNSFVVLRPDGLIGTVYDKRHLVPFGEYIPLRPLAERIGLGALASTIGSGFAKGQVGGTLDIPGIGGAIPLICYEGIFAEEIVRGDQDPRVMILITNDAWFGQAAGPYQHLAQARLRAIEQGLPMIRVANTGVSAMIDGKGRITSSLPLGEEGVLDVVLPPALDKTIYARWGDLPLCLIVSLLTLGLYASTRREID